MHGMRENLFLEAAPHPTTALAMPTALGDVRSHGQSGKHLLALSFSGFDPNQKLSRIFAVPHKMPNCE